MKLKNILFIGVIITAIISTLVIPTNIFAASTSIAASETNVKVGDSVTISAAINGAASWALGAEVTGGTFTKSDSSVGNTDSGENENKTVVVGTFSASTAGTYTVTLTGYVVDFSEETSNKVNATGSIKINVEAPEESNSGNTGSGEENNSGSNENAGENENSGNNENTENKNNENTNNTENKEEEKKEEPNFENASATMYVKGDTVNLRKDWSTSDGSVQVSKGTELSIVATSNNKVNGHIWYKVNYKGSIRYVASDLLTSEKPEEEEKSDNANLKSLSIEGYETKPAFKASTLSYTLEVGNDINELKINAEAEDSKAKVDIEGNKDFKEGENKVSVKVTAEDGTEKVYELNVTKAKGVVFGLKSLKIKDTDMDKTFKTEVYSYKINVNDVDKLEIEAVPSVDTASIEILGNENLQDGENTVTIIVKSEDGKETKTYQITVNKNVANATEENKTDNGVQLDGRVYLYGGICLLAVILLIILIVFLIRNKKKNRDDNDPDDGDLYDYDKHNDKFDKFDKFNNEFSNDFNETAAASSYGVNEKQEDETNIEEKSETYYKEDQYSPEEEEEETNVVANDYEEKDDSFDNEYSAADNNEPTQEELERDIEKQFGSLYNNDNNDDFDDEDDDDRKPRRGRGKHF